MTTAEFRHLFLVGAGFSADKIPPIMDEETWRELSLQALASLAGPPGPPGPPGPEGGPKTFGITVDGAGQVLTTGSKGFVTIPYDCTITNWYLVADTFGGSTFDIKRDGTSLVGTGNFPSLLDPETGYTVSRNAAVSGWTSVAITAGDILEFVSTNESTEGATKVNLVIKAI